MENGDKRVKVGSAAADAGYSATSRLDAVRALWKDNACFLILLLVIAIQSSLLVNRIALEYDGAYNLQIPANIAKGLGYSSDFGTIKQFDYQVTTGYPVLLPTALAFKAFGAGVWQFRIVSIGYYLGFVTMLYVISKKISNKWVALLPAAMFFVFSSLRGHLSSRYSLLGEIPAAFFLLLAVYFIERALGDKHKAVLYSALAGLSAALAAQSKTVFLLALPAIAAVYFYDVFAKKRPASILSLGILLTAFLLPLFSWNVYTRLSLGSDLYREYRAKEKTFFQQSGSGVAEHEIIVSTALLPSKIRELSRNTHLAPDILLAAATAIVAALLFRLYRDRITPAEITVAVFVIAYFSWWLFISNRDWFRHVMPAYAVSFVLTASLCSVVFDVLGVRGRRMMNGLAAATAVVAAIVACAIVRPAKMDDLATQIAFADKVTILRKDRDVVYQDWWQTPEIAFLCGEPFAKYEDVKKKGDKKKDPIIIFSPVEKWQDHEKYLKRKSLCKEILSVVGEYEACTLSVR